MENIELEGFASSSHEIPEGGAKAMHHCHMSDLDLGINDVYEFRR